MSLKNDCLKNKKTLMNKFIRVHGRPAKIVGMGGKTIKLGFPMPNGFSHKAEMVTGFVNWENITPELSTELRRILPVKEGQQTLF